MEAGSSNGVAGLAEEWDKFHLTEEDEGGMDLSKEDSEGAVSETEDLRFCLIGQFLTAKPINFNAMKNNLASIWEPVKEITITEVGICRSVFDHHKEITITEPPCNGSA